MGHLHAAIGSGGACALACGLGVQATGFSVVFFFFSLLTLLFITSQTQLFFPPFLICS